MKNEGGFSKIVTQLMVLGVIVIGGVVYFAFEMPATNPQGSAPTALGLTANQIKTAEYTLPDFGGPFTFDADDTATTSAVEGKGSAGATLTYTATLMSDKTAFGDLNGDGAIDAVVPAVEQLGGSGSFYYLVAFLNDNGTPKEAAAVPLGDRIIVNSITIKDGEIAVAMLDHGPNDGMARATLPVTKYFVLQNSNLVESSKTPQINTTTTGESSAWKTYLNSQYGFTFQYPEGWQISDTSEMKDGRKWPSVNITSPLRYNLPGYDGVPTEYRILIFFPTASGTSPSTRDMEPIAGFGSPDPQFGHQSAWNIEVPRNVLEASSEYQDGQQIMSSFKFIPSPPLSVYPSPNGKIDVYTITSTTLESILSVNDASTTGILSRLNLTSEDGEHGAIADKLLWTPDSKFFILATHLSGGHMPWSEPTYIYVVSKNMWYSLDDFLGKQNLAAAGDVKLATDDKLILEPWITGGGSGEPTTTIIDISSLPFNEVQPVTSTPYR
ncbi:hypothetical protein M1413_03285 [Patescibacteria group bacterium]|nr:hypothetical protein [Patescibacteria group bacterium]MCL5114215.1 hypothetical protein [Patescibacteria group bacterium]